MIVDVIYRATPFVCCRISARSGLKKILTLSDLSYTGDNFFPSLAVHLFQALAAVRRARFQGSPSQNLPLPPKQAALDLEAAQARLLFRQQRKRRRLGESLEKSCPRGSNLDCCEN